MDSIRRNGELNIFLEKIPFIKRMLILKKPAIDYGNGHPQDYQRRVKRTILSAVEIMAIYNEARAEGFTPESIREAEQLAKTELSKAS